MDCLPVTMHARSSQFSGKKGGGGYLYGNETGSVMPTLNEFHHGWDWGMKFQYPKFMYTIPNPKFVTECLVWGSNVINCVHLWLSEL